MYQTHNTRDVCILTLTKQNKNRLTNKNSYHKNDKSEMDKLWSYSHILKRKKK